MPNAVDLTVDVTDAAGIDEACHTAVTVFFPDEGQLSDPPVVCFAFPGGGYSRHFYSFAMPWAPEGGQATWHTDRGWIFVTCDHLGVGDSSLPGDLRLTYENIAAANAATVESVREPVALGIGQSMGGCFLIVSQGRHQIFDGIGVLGYSAIHTSVPSRPGTPPVVWPWMPRDSDLTDPVLLNPAAVAAAERPLVTDQEALEQAATASGEHPFTWASSTTTNRRTWWPRTWLPVPVGRCRAGARRPRPVCDLHGRTRHRRPGSGRDHRPRVRVPPDGPHAQVRPHPLTTVGPPPQLGRGCRSTDRLTVEHVRRYAGDGHRPARRDRRPAC